MRDELVTLGTFPTLTEAGFFRSLLESEGIPSYLTDDALIGMNPLLGNTVGWIKLQVAERDFERAADLLEARKSDAAEMSPQDFAAQALEEEPRDDEEGDSKATADPQSGAEGDDEIEDPLEALAQRAFRASVIGLAFFPLLFYAVWLLCRLVFTKGEWSGRTSRNAWMAAAVLSAFAGTIWLFYMSH